ncbi:hypothetical protein HAZT_HAZT005106 [Hyalella azteca]|uniref:Telomere length and silencing protein 1 homolog isoform X2 n=1 Tax=Hyalella azteca TaxID=294128 RepID=A0A6A0GXY5_HYAAZ|nr:telomere length and silencing protein 1 homolog isoform X2 [Hyalella azteca]KAA0190378.1 hypothetical protein HAZT_HAZT005106 [Hyalella azteca]
MGEEKSTMFKKIKSKSIRQRRFSEDEESDDEETLSLKIEENKLLRKLKQRVGGVTAEALLAGSKDKEKKKDDDPYKTKKGGMVDLKDIKNAPKMDDAYDTGIGTAFSAETNRRDEDAEMQKYIEENLAKRKGQQDGDQTNSEENRYLTPEQAALNAVPEFLRKSSSKTNEEMLSNQMLSGIPEIDLGLEAKIRNIEATEETKQKLLRDSLRKKDKPSEFVPKNMAVNFVQHNRFNIEEGGPQKKKEKKEEKFEEVVEPVVGGGVKVSTLAPKKPTAQKATDDFHYEKFRKQFRRH